MKRKLTSVASTALLVAVSTLALVGGVFVEAAEDGSCSAGSGGGACQAPVAVERASEAASTAGGLFGGFSFGSLTSLFGIGEYHGCATIPYGVFFTIRGIYSMLWCVLCVLAMR